MTNRLLQRQCPLELVGRHILPLPKGRAWLGTFLIHLSLQLLIRFFGLGDWLTFYFIVFFRYLRMGEVLWGATHVVLHVYVGGGGCLQPCLDKKSE